MNEKDYILITDKTVVEDARRLLRELIPDNNFHINQSEYETVMRVLSMWSSRMYKQIELETHGGE